MKGITRKRWFGWARDIAVVLALYAAIGVYQTRHAAHGEAPALQATLLDGGQLDLAQDRGEPLMLHFWATWCRVCKAEEHNVVALAENHRVITVASHSGSAAAVREYAGDAGLNLPIVVDTDAQLSRRFGVSAFPTSFFIDAKGNITAVETGYTTELGMRLRMWWAGL